jgi:AcrR family transcriptional regulator
MARTGRRPNSPPDGGAVGPADGGAVSHPTTRDSILGAARATFAERGFEGATMREIAAAAGVDQALIHHYFGSKQQLFVAAMELPFDPDGVRATVLAGPRDEIGERIVRFFLGLWEEPVRRQVLLGMVRSATTDPRAAEMVRRFVIEGGVLPLVREAGVTDSAMRATLVGSHLIGLGFVRYILCVEPLASAPIEAVVQAVGPVIGRYMAAPLDASSVEARSEARSG